MKKIKIILGSFVLITIISVITLIVYKEKVFNQFPKSYDFAVIDTTGQSNNSYIYYYNTAGEKVYEQNIKMGYMGDTFSFPQIEGTNMYTTPWGIDLIRDLSVVLEYNIRTGEYSTYDTTMYSANSLAVTDQYFFTVNTIDNVTKLARTNRSTLKTDIIEFPEYYIGKIAVYNDILYAFGTNSMDDKNADFIEISTSTMEVLSKKNIREYGECPAESTLLIGDNLYFTFPYKNQKDEETPNNTLTVFNTKTKEFTNIELPDFTPFQLLKYQDNIIISHVDPVLDEGNSLSIFNTKTGDVKNVQLENTPRQLVINKDYLYSLDITNRSVCKYQLKDNELTLVHTYSIKSRNENTYYFLSGLVTSESE